MQRTNAAALAHLHRVAAEVANGDAVEGNAEVEEEGVEEVEEGGAEVVEEEVIVGKEEVAGRVVVAVVVEFLGQTNLYVATPVVLDR